MRERQIKRVVEELTSFVSSKTDLKWLCIVREQVEQRSGFTRDRERERDREARPERDNTQGFSRMFQNNLPPRFQKQAADRPPYYRQGSGSSPQPSSGAQPSFDPRWSSGSQYGGTYR